MNKIFIGLFLFSFSLFADPILKFGDTLYREKDYYRAITEYKRFLHTYPNHPKNNQVEFQIGFSYLKGEKWDAAIPYFQKLQFSSLSQEAHLALAQTYFYSKRDELALNEWNQFLKKYPKSRYSKKVAALKKEMLEFDPKPYRSPFLAGTLSAVLPGLGQWYDGRFWDGLSALLVNGMFAYGIYATFRDEHYPSAGILIFLGSGFYGGNIFSAVSSAYKFNQNVKESSWISLKNRYGFNLDWNGSTLTFSF